MDIPTEQAPIYSFEVRERILTTEMNLSRDSSMSSGQETPYHNRMGNNKMDLDSEPENNSSELFYETEQEKTIRFSKANETTDNIRL